MTLLDASLKQEYTIKSIETENDELNSFLFSLGCYSGERITVVKQSKHSCIILIKDARYNIDNHLAAAISIE